MKLRFVLLKQNEYCEGCGCLLPTGTYVYKITVEGHDYFYCSNCAYTVIGESDEGIE